MKLSKKERCVASTIVGMKQLEFTLDELCSAMAGEKGPNFRNAMAVTLRSMTRKMATASVKFHRTTKLGRGYKATYSVDKSFFQKMR